MLKLSDESSELCRPSASKSLNANPEFLLGIAPQVLFDKSRIESVKTSIYGRVGGKEVSRSSRGQRHIEKTDLSLP